MAGARQREETMEYRNLGRSGVKVSALCLGCMNFGGRTDETGSVRIIHAAIDAGINFLDTANVYGRGASETIVSKALAGGRRDDVFLATKCSSRMGDGPNDEGSNRYHIMKQIEGSLGRLGTDHVDLYQLHWMDLETPPEESMRALDDLVRQGKVRYIGVSKWTPAWTVEAIMLAERYGWTKIVTEQPPYNLCDRSIENDLVWTCMRHGIGIIPWAPLATGILSGQYARGKQPPGDSRFAKRGWDNRLTEAAVDRADALKPLAAEKGVTLAEFSLAWVMRQPGITAPIIGVRTMEHLESALRSLDVDFTDEDHRRIDEIAPPGSAVSDYWDINAPRRCRRAAGISET
jgi:aryl-alcohol dehydrogenase-like predicted oxidoreductase